MNWLKRLFRRKPAPIVTAIAGENILAGSLVFIVEGRAYGITPQQLTRAGRQIGKTAMTHNMAESLLKK